MKKNNFHYRIGTCETTTPWLRPCPYNLTAWRDELFKKIQNFGDYKLWLLGAVIEGHSTWDIDIIITGELNNVKKLEDIIICMIETGFENRLLIDPWWHKDIEPYILLGHKCKKMQLACQEVIDTGSCTGTKCLGPRKIPLQIVIPYDTVEKNNQIIKKIKGARKISERLWMIEGQNNEKSSAFFSQKNKKKIESTLINSTHPIPITKETVFYKYISWP